ncbi:TIGR03943 family putative permease subunit [Spirillospora sp. CA-294931]|uniref:TIGR03943 family putative permease subunit n=1 Tax=Spirillospora sp. CA-294931 TaxID=3240042 RepID=UPI003D94FCB6
MTRSAQNLLLILIGGAILWITLATSEYLNYVKPGFRWFLVAAAVVVLALGAAGLRREWREADEAKKAGEKAGEPDEAVTLDKPEAHDDHDDHGHDHSHGPRVAWLLCLPVLAIFIIAPPALGSFTASRDTGRTAPPPPPPAQGYAALPQTGAPIAMTMSEFIGRSYEAQTGQSATLKGVTVRLTGFVTPMKKGGGWQVTRLKMSCCAGDAIAFPVVVRGLAKPPADAWVEVDGIWQPSTGGMSKTGLHEIVGTSVKRVKRPKNAYE